jgi:hypothetical protein
MAVDELQAFCEAVFGQTAPSPVTSFSSRVNRLEINNYTMKGPD